MKKSKETQINNTLLNILSPMSLEIKRNNIILGENTGKIYGILNILKTYIMVGYPGKPLYVEQFAP